MVRGGNWWYNGGYKGGFHLWNKILDYFQGYDYPYDRVTDLEDVATGYAELKHAQIILNRNNQKTRVHIWTAHIV